MTAAEILATSKHRPIPLPNRPWVMRQEWHDLLFAHWAIEPASVRPLVPPPLELDLWENKAYVAITPFLIRRLRPRGAPALPGVSNFPELNVRTYVRYQDIAGVYFFSLDARNAPAVLGARVMYGLPYFRAHMNVEQAGDFIHYQSQRVSPQPAEVRGMYRPVSAIHGWQPPSQSLERFLCERYCLCVVERRRVYRTHIHHVPWPLQTATAEIECNSMTAPLGITLPASPPLLHFSRGSLTCWCGGRSGLRSRSKQVWQV